MNQDEYQERETESASGRAGRSSGKSGSSSRKTGSSSGKGKGSSGHKSASHKKHGARTSSASGHRRRRKKKRPNGHLIFFAVLAAALLITVIQLLLWNKGKKSDYDPNSTTTEFDVEVLDYLMPVDPDFLKGRADDGVTTVLALGNDPFDGTGDGESLASLIEAEADVKVLNGAFPGSTIAMKNQTYDSSYPLDGLSLYWTAAAICNHNFDLMEVVVRDLASDACSSALQTLRDVDMETVDDLIIFYDLQDYMGRRIVYDESNPNNLNTCYGALNATIQLIAEQYPHIRIFVFSPTWGTFTEGDGTVRDADLDDMGNGTVADYVNWELEVCRSNGVTFIDMYYGGVSMDNRDCLTDGWHLNEKGRRRIAERFSQILHRWD